MANTVKTTLLLGFMTGLFLLVGELIGGGQGLVVGFLFAVVTNFVSYFWSDKIVLRSYGAKEVCADHRLYKIVSYLAQRSWLPMPRVFIFSVSSPYSIDL